MIGNDLVDLNQALKESNWRRKGYLDKVFTPAEQELIAKAANPDELVWLLWSMKEAAYKIHNRRTALREYAPLKLNCLTENKSKGLYKGTVQIDGIDYHTKSNIHAGNYIHTHAAETDQELELIKESVYVNASNMDYKALKPVCVSHHGQYLALIF